MASAADSPSHDSTLSPLADDDLEMMLLIRHFEHALLDAFSRGKLNGTTHTCIGQEAIPVAISHFLGSGDFQFSNHRGHGHYLSRFNDPSGLLAEIMGREGAVCNGVGGSQHIYREGQYASTGIQGESLPAAVGVALHLKRAGNGNLAAVHIGDGTWGEGSVYEALNIAQLWSLPLLVLVENNGIAQSTPVALQMAGTIEARAAAFGIAFVKISFNDVNLIRVRLKEPISSVRSANKPLIVEFETSRLGPHSKGDDTRPAASIDALRAHDWYTLVRQEYRQQFERLDARVRSRVDELFAEVERRGPSQWNTES